MEVCPSENDLLAFASGSLLASRRGKLESHLRHCYTCAASVAVGASTLSERTLPDATEPNQRHATPLAPGERFGRFEIEGVVGRGGWGTVYRATDTELQRLVAIKVMTPPQATPDATRALQVRLQAEARSMAQLTHPNVVTLHDVGVFDNRPFVVMELVPGMNVRQWLAETERDWREVVRVFVDAGKGLSAAHAVGIAHRDFKPENVLIAPDKHAKVTDFGLASSFDELERRAAIAPAPVGLTGTPAFMSPEQILGQAVDARSDQFSFCLSLSIALHSRHPFLGHSHAGTSLSELLRAIVLGVIHPAPPSAIPRALDAALERGMARDPEDRFPHLNALLAELEAATAPRRSSRPLLAALIVAAAVVLTSMLGWWVAHQRGSATATLPVAEDRGAVLLPRAPPVAAVSLPAAVDNPPLGTSAASSTASSAVPATRARRPTQPSRAKVVSQARATPSGDQLLNPFRRVPSDRAAAP